MGEKTYGIPQGASRPSVILYIHILKHGIDKHNVDFWFSTDEAQFHSSRTTRAAQNEDGVKDGGGIVDLALPLMQTTLYFCLFATSCPNRQP